MADTETEVMSGTTEFRTERQKDNRAGVGTSARTGQKRAARLSPAAGCTAGEETTLAVMEWERIR